MLHKMRKPTAIVLAFLICITMFTGIVLPQIAETATAVNDPYADVHNKTRELTVTDGKVTPFGTTTSVTVPNEYKDLPVYEAEDTKLFFYNSAWKTPADAGVSAEGDYFVARYGDGIEWGDGRVYLMQYGVNAYGGTDYTGSYAYDELLVELQKFTPTAGSDNHHYILFFPGEYANTENSTTNANGNQHVFNLPSNSDPAVEDIMHIHYVGPQAGKNPTMGAVGDTKINNGRSVDKTREFVTTTTFRFGTNVYTHVDGFASTNPIYYLTDTNKFYAGVEIRNVYAEFHNFEYHPIFCFGQGMTEASLTVTVKDCYFNGENGVFATSRQWDDIYGHEITLDNVVFNRIKKNSFTFYAAPKSQAASKFAGGDGKFEVNVTNCTIINWEEYRLFNLRQDAEHNAHDYYEDDSAFANFSNNRVLGFGDPTSESTVLTYAGLSTDNGVYNAINTTITDNFFEISPEVLAKKQGNMIATSNFPENSKPLIIHGNTFKADVSNQPMADLNSTHVLVDLSDNLFLDQNNNVRVMRHTWMSYGFDNNAKVLTDTYASDEMSGGITELFTVLDAKQDLFVANCYIQTAQQHQSTYPQTYGTAILGSITIMPKPGVTYQAKDLFIYNNPEVTFVGLFSDKMCTDPVSSFDSEYDFANLYAKATYNKGTTKATIVYKIYKPIEYDFLSPTSTILSEYTFPFDGVTYTAGKNDNGITANFYAINNGSMQGAANQVVGGRPTPAGKDEDIKYQQRILVLTPGTYTSAQLFNHSAAIVGPMLGETPADGKSDAALHGRSADPTKEAVFNGTFYVNPKNNPYFAVGGIASTHSQQWITTKITNADYSGEVDSFGLKRTVHLSVQDSYFQTTSDAAMMALGENGSNYDCRLTFDHCYYKSTGKGAPIYELFGRMGRVTNSSIIMEKRNEYWFYLYAPSPLTLGFTPASADQVVENSYIARPATTGTAQYDYSMTLRTTYYPKDNNNIFDSTESYVDGAKARINNNTFIDNAVIHQTMFADSKSSLEFTGNKVIRTTSTPSTIPVLSSYVPGVNITTMVTDYNISKNAFINCQNPFTFVNENIPDVNENFYGDSTGKVLPIADTENIEIDTSWWYVNEACTVTTKDIELTKGGFLNVEIGDYGDYEEYTATLYATIGKTYGFSDYAAKNAEVIGVYKNPSYEALESNITFTGEPFTVYVKVKKDNYIATWKVNVQSVDVWSEKGLAPVDDETFVDLSTVNSYKDRQNGNAYKFVFLAADWTKWAYTDATLKTKVSSDPSKLEEGEAGTDWSDTDPQEIDEGVVFYAQMPTTGIIYKLTYGVTAMNYRHCNTGNFATMVFFPGLYNQHAAYNSDDSSYDYTKQVGSNGYFGIARAGKIPAECKEVNILGPQAGIPGGNVDNGIARDPTSHNGRTDVLAECCFAAATNFYLMNGAIGEGKTLNFDGIGGGWGFKMNSIAGTGADNTKTAVTSTINFNNCAFRHLDGGQYFLDLYSEKEAINANADDGKKLSKINWTLNFNRTAIELHTNNGVSPKYGISRTVANQIHFNECVLSNSTRAATTDPLGFYINPVRGDMNTNRVAVSYTCENSYVDWKNSYLFGVYLNATKNLNTNTREKIEVAFRNNTIIGSSMNSEESYLTRASIASFFTSPGDGNDIADAAAITDIIFTDNKVLNDSGEYPKYGYVLYGYDMKDDEVNGYRTVDISGNTFKGYNNLFPYFQGLDLKDNLYLDIHGRPIAGRFAGMSDITTSDVVLNEEFTRFASDFTIKGGVKMTSPLSWEPGSRDIHGEATHAYAAGLTGEDLKNSLIFKSDKVCSVELYDEDGVTPATMLAEGETYRLVLTYKDMPDVINVIYDVTIEPDPEKEYPLYNEGKIFWDPAVQNYEYGAKVIRELDGTEYQFTVGKNILGTVGEFPIVPAADANGNPAPRRHVYLFAREYGSPDNLFYAEDEARRGLITCFYGVNHGKSAVEKDASGIPVGRADDRTDPAGESIFRNATFANGCQSMVQFDGVMFADLLYVSENSGELGTRIVELKVQNCTTHPDAPISFSEANKSFSLNNGKTMHTIEVFDNYFETTDVTKDSYLITARNTRDTVLRGNYFMPGGTKMGLIYTAVDDANDDGYINAELDQFNFDASKNYLGGEINFGSLRAQNSVANNFAYNISINENRFDLINGQQAIKFTRYTGSNSTGYVNFKDLSLEILNNEFSGGPDAVRYIAFTGLKTNNVNNVDPKRLRVSGNTFHYSDEAPVQYAVENYSDTVLDLSENTFDGFNANYGDQIYVNPVAPELRLVNANSTFKDAPLNSQNVLFSGASNAKFIIEGKEFLANYEAPGATLADAAASGKKVADTNTKTITDVATSGPDHNAYTFNPAIGMMVKVKASNGTVYENYYPAITDEKNAKATFTAQLCTIAGTPVGEEYTVTVYVEPIKLNIKPDDCTVVQQDGQATLTWMATFRGQHSTYISDLINKSGMKVVEYGMFYGSDEAAVSDLVIAKGYVDGKYTVEGKVLGQKAIHSANENGLNNVKLDYAQRVTVDLPKQTEARYGRMYMTYKVGDKLYTVLSDAVTLTMYVGN